MDPYLLKRLWRRPWLSLCSLLMSIVLCIMVGYLSEYRQEQQEKLDQAVESFDILCVVTDKRGTRSTGLRMEADVLDFIREEDSAIAPYIRDIRITKEFQYSGIESGSQSILIGVTNERCADALDPALGMEVYYFVEDFYDREDPVCLVSEKLYRSLDSEVLTLTVTDPAIDREEAPDLGTGTVQLQVAGYYTGRGSDIYMPFDAAMALAMEISQRTSCDSIAFLAAENRNLEILSRFAFRKFGVVDPQAPMELASGLALTIQDAQYRSTVAAFEQNIRRAGYLVPVVLLLGLGVGFLASFLSTRNENRTYALMRTLGMNSRKLFGSILREQLVLAVLAAVIALVISGAWVPIAIYLVCYLIGCVACVAKTIKVAPTAILRKQE